MLVGAKKDYAPYTPKESTLKKVSAPLGRFTEKSLRPV